MSAAKDNLYAIPSVERDSTLAAMSTLERIMPAQAQQAKKMQEAFIKAGFTSDEALTLVAYAIFRN